MIQIDNKLVNIVNNDTVITIDNKFAYRVFAFCSYKIELYSFNSL
jgi:hypothetical protein